MVSTAGGQTHTLPNAASEQLPHVLSSQWPSEEGTGSPTLQRDRYKEVQCTLQVCVYVRVCGGGRGMGSGLHHALRLCTLPPSRPPPLQVRATPRGTISPSPDWRQHCLLLLLPPPAPELRGSWKGARGLCPFLTDSLARKEKPDPPLAGEFLPPSSSSSLPSHPPQTCKPAPLNGSYPAPLLTSSSPLTSSSSPSSSSSSSSSSSTT